jgi:uncharacterized damage-inducible protein DinB
METAAVFVDFSGRKLVQQASRIVICLKELSDEQIWTRANENSNAIGNLVLHLCGNVRQWLMAGVGGAVDVRRRDDEFGAVSGGELGPVLMATVDEACAVLRSVTEARLAERVTVQGYHVTVLEAVYHVVEHFSGHTGQIIQMTKAMTRRPLNFYAHLGGSHTEATP